MIRSKFLDLKSNLKFSLSRKFNWNHPCKIMIIFTVIIRFFCTQILWDHIRYTLDKLIKKIKMFFLITKISNSVLNQKTLICSSDSNWFFKYYSSFMMDWYGIHVITFANDDISELSLSMSEMYITGGKISKYSLSWGKILKLNIFWFFKDFISSVMILKSIL